MERLPNSGQYLAYSRSFWLQRQGSHPPGRSDNILQTIQSKNSSNFKVIQKSTRAEAKDILFQSVESLRRRGFPVLWVLRYPDLQNSTITSIDVIRMLPYQALEMNSSAMSTQYPITIAQLKETSTQQEVAASPEASSPGVSHRLHRRRLRLYGTCYGSRQSRNNNFLVEAVKVLGSEKVRVVAPSHVFESQRALRDLGDEAVASLKTDSPAKRTNVVVQRRRHMARKQRLT
ncbi:hypothetical protein QC761_405617 [Podospora bellae-mahoneyi]|uniref:Uncharacterized protein n=1 Tax=Podospora bellae-mahoneyi TaxID=2093777 RepID=A0ABR0FIE9_9PEZI|nr:hypothetical protein QC761_405617 [Podospora bellae-mahoneyi]